MQYQVTEEVNDKPKEVPRARYGSEQTLATVNMAFLQTKPIEPVFEDINSGNHGAEFTIDNERRDIGMLEIAHTELTDISVARKTSFSETRSLEVFEEARVEQRKQRRRPSTEVLYGTPIKEGHRNYLLMYFYVNIRFDMLTGIRISVSRCNSKAPTDLDPSEFTAAHKLAFDAY